MSKTNVQIRTMDESTKLRMNLMAIQKVDPYAKEIMDSCPHVAYYRYISNEWQKSEIEGSFFVYSRVAEPTHSIFINNRLNTNSLVEPITKPMELQSQPPFLLYRNQRQSICGFWFYCKEDCVRIYSLLEKLIKKCSTASGPNESNLVKSDQISQHPPAPMQHQQPPPPQQAHQQQHHHHHQQQQQQPPVNILQNNNGGGGGGNKQEIDIFSMLSKAQAEFNHSNGSVGFAPANAVEAQFAEMKINMQQQQQQQPKHQLPPSNPHQPLMKQLSSALPDITHPNVVSFFAAAVQPSNGVIEGGAAIHPPQQAIMHGPPPAHFVSAAGSGVVAPNQMHSVPTLDEIEKQHRVSSISPKVSSDQKLLNNILQSSAGNMPNSQPPKMPGIIQVQPKQPTLITPAMFQATASTSHAAEEKAPAQNSRPEPLTQNQLIQALNYLLENDPDFIQKIHEAYIKSFNKKLSL